MSGLRGTVGKGHVIEAVEMIPSGGGVFDVFADGELIYSKKQTGRHAKKGEVLGILKSRIEKR